MKSICTISLILLFNHLAHSQQIKCTSNSKPSLCLEVNIAIVSLSFNAINNNNKRVGFQFENTSDSYEAFYKYTHLAFSEKKTDGYMLQFENDHIIIKYANKRISIILYQNNNLETVYISTPITFAQLQHLLNRNKNVTRI